MGTGTARSPGGGVPARGRRPELSVNLLPLLWTGVRLHPPGRTDRRTSADVSAPRLAGFPLINDDSERVVVVQPCVLTCSC